MEVQGYQYHGVTSLGTSLNHTNTWVAQLIPKAGTPYFGSTGSLLFFAFVDAASSVDVGSNKVSFTLTAKGERGKDKGRSAKPSTVDGAS